MHLPTQGPCALPPLVVDSSRRPRAGAGHELRVYADEGHGLTHRANREEASSAAIAFLADLLSRG